MKQRYCPECNSETVVMFYEDCFEAYPNPPKIKKWKCLDCGCEFEDPFKKIGGRLVAVHNK